MTIRTRWVRLALCALTMIVLHALPASAQEAGAQDQFWDAAQAGDTLALAAALTRGATLDALDTRRSANGRRALNWAAWFNHPHAVRWLVKKGAKVNLANLTGFTPLHHAAENGSLDAARALVAVGADRKAVTAGGLTALDVARAREQLLVTAFLDSLSDK